MNSAKEGGGGKEGRKLNTQAKAWTRLISSDRNTCTEEGGKSLKESHLFTKKKENPAGQGGTRN